MHELPLYRYIFTDVLLPLTLGEKKNCCNEKIISKMGGKHAKNKRLGPGKSGFIYNSVTMADTEVLTQNLSTHHISTIP